MIRPQRFIDIRLYGTLSFCRDSENGIWTLLTYLRYLPTYRSFQVANRLEMFHFPFSFLHPPSKSASPIHSIPSHVYSQPLLTDLQLPPCLSEKNRLECPAFAGPVNAMLTIEASSIKYQASIIKHQSSSTRLDSTRFSQSMNSTSFLTATTL